MLFAPRFAPGIQAGSINVTFRRWKRRQVVAGNRYRTPVGRIAVDAVDVVTLEEITEMDAVAAGFDDLDELRTVLNAKPGLEIFRVRFHPYDGPDERASLAAADRITADERAELGHRLDRLDRASRHGPWTRQVLRAIEARPATRAGDLADQFGRERLPFKADVRKLKNLGLTHSLEIGYELSPRGRAFLAGDPTA